MLPEQDRKMLAKHPGRLTPAGQAQPEHDGRVGLSTMAPMLLFLGLITWGMSTLGGMLADWLATVISVLGAIISVLAVLGTLSERKAIPTAHAHHGRYFCGPDFDEIARAALARARSAIEQVQESTVVRDGLLDTIDNAVVLPEQLWQIAKSLHAQTELRAHQASLGDSPFTAAVEAAIKPQRRALELSVADTERRIAGLEAYALRVRAADDAFLERRRLRRVLERNDDYRELVAQISDSGTDELQQLNEQADSVAKTFAESLSLAGEAGQALVLPADNGSSTSPKE
jgi:hypothetical protein